LEASGTKRGKKNGGYSGKDRLAFKAQNLVVPKGEEKLVLGTALGFPIATQKKRNSRKPGAEKKDRMKKRLLTS